MVEQGTENPRVIGSIPIGGTILYAAVAHLVERHLAKVEVASSSLVGRSTNQNGLCKKPVLHMVTWPSGKAKVCKTFIHRFKSDRHLQEKPPKEFGGFFVRISTEKGDREVVLWSKPFGIVVLLAAHSMDVLQ